MKNILLALAVFSTYTFSQTKLEPKFFVLQNSINEIKVENKSLQNFTTEVSNSKKSAGLAILYSFLLPGMGELYANSYSSGKYFTIAEGSLWGIYFGMNTYGNWLKDRYISYASSTGMVNSQNKNADYYATIGDYMSIDEYNNAMALQQSFDKMLDPTKNYWNWQTIANRKNYRNMWVSSEQEHNDLRFIVGALILNRIASAINAVRLVAEFNKKQSTELGWNFSVDANNPATLPSTLYFNFQTTF
ncbi:MAG: hypothetical protein M1480_20335 [Bacteroidetes bacterium]|nr:hypothetical protein [Bacteroidota bacterium]